MPLEPLSIRVPKDFKRRLVRHREETGVPTAVTIRRAVEKVLPPEAPPEPKKKPKPSSN